MIRLFFLTFYDGRVDNKSENENMMIGLIIYIFVEKQSAWGVILCFHYCVLHPCLKVSVALIVEAHG